jgi:hypothetical protein
MWRGSGTLVVSRQDSVSSVQSYPRVVARDRASASVGLKLWPAHNQAAALPATMGGELLPREALHFRQVDRIPCQLL